VKDIDNIFTIRLKSIFISIEEKAMFATYTAKYTKITTGCMGLSTSRKRNSLG
jgi:hypothetical protein